MRFSDACERQQSSGCWCVHICFGPIHVCVCVCMSPSGQLYTGKCLKSVLISILQVEGHIFYLIFFFLNSFFNKSSYLVRSCVLVKLCNSMHVINKCNNVNVSFMTKYLFF